MGLVVDPQGYITFTDRKTGFRGIADLVIGGITDTEATFRLIQTNTGKLDAISKRTELIGASDPTGIVMNTKFLDLQANTVDAEMNFGQANLADFPTEEKHQVIDVFNDSLVSGGPAGHGAYIDPDVRSGHIIFTDRNKDMDIGTGQMEGEAATATGGVNDILMILASLKGDRDR